MEANPSLTGGPPPRPTASAAAVRVQTLVGVGVLLVGLGLAFGAISIPSEAGYGGVGPNFLPWVCAIVLTVCGAWIIWEARSGGFREMEPADESADPAYWSGFVWLSAG
jgi:putative tricarboxylic transport membrane protein